MNKKYCIARLGHYYQPVSGYSYPEFLTDDGWSNIDTGYYDSLDEAIAIVNNLAKADNNYYILGHNEYASPTYLVVDSDAADYIASGRNSDLSNFDWPDNLPCGACGECATCAELMIVQDRDYLIHHSLYTAN